MRATVCSKCGKRYPSTVPSCPTDGASLADAALVEGALGRTIGNFRIEKLLGAGGMGTVFLARHVKIGSPAVVKVLTPGHADDEDFAASQKRFVNEARLASTIVHSHVVRVFDCGEIPVPGSPHPQLYTIMELVEGEDCESALAREGRMEPLRAARILRQVASALDAAHTSPHGAIIHRDLKPGNIRLTKRGREEHAVVLDFGIAKAIEAPLDDRVTIPGMILGTPRYMAPEQAQGSTVDARTDIYALGVVAYELLAGKPPFEASSLLQVFAKHAVEPPPPFPDELAIPPALAAIVFRCLEKEPPNRYQTAAELCDALDRFLSAQAPAAGGRRTAVALVVGAALVALGVVAWKVLAPAPPSPARARLASLVLDGRESAEGEPVYTRAGAVRLAGRLEGDAPEGAEVRVTRADGREVAYPVADGVFEGEIRDLPVEGREDVTLALGEETLARRTIVRDVSAPRLAARAAGSEQVSFAESDRVVYVRATGAALSIEVSDDSPVEIAAEPEPPLEALAGARAIELRTAAMKPGVPSALTVRAKDRAGNEASLRFDAIYDPAPPELRITAIEAPVDADRARITVAFEDATGIASIVLSGRGPAGPLAPRPPIDLRPGAATFEVATPEEGEYELRVVATDRAGNASEVLRALDRAIEFRPEVTLRGLEPTAEGTCFTNKADVQIDIRANKPWRKATVTFEGVGGAAAGRTITPESEGPTLIALETAQTLVVAVEPASGATIERRIRVVHDATPPVLRVPELPEWTDRAAAPEGTISLDARAEDPNLAEVEITCDPPGVTVAPRAPIPVAHGTTLTLTVRAWDRAGNTAELARKTRIDLAPPVLAIGAPPRLKLHETAIVRVNADEPLRELRAVRSTAAVRRESERSFTIEVTMLLDTPREWTLEAVDPAGNTGTARFALEIDRICVVTGAAYEEADWKRMLDDPRARVCTHCGQKVRGGAP